MSRYIDADKLIEALQTEFDLEPTLATEEQDKWFKRGIKCAIRNVDYIPTADVEEVKHGEWKEVKTGEELYDYCFKCSNCNRETPTNSFVVSPDHCPYCGAKMDGGKGE